MEERKEEGEAEIQEHGPEHWFSKWERQCLAEAEQDEQLPPELQEEAAAEAQPEHKQQKLWHLFQNSATAVAQLYKGEPSPPSCRRRLGADPRRRAPGWLARLRPPPRCPLLTRWRRGRPVLGGRPGEARGRRGGDLLWGPAWRSSPAPPDRLPGAPGPWRAGEEPPVTKWRREATRPALLCPKPASGRGLRGHLPAPRLGLGLRLRAPRLSLPPLRDPFPVFLPVTLRSRNP